MVQQGSGNHRWDRNLPLKRLSGIARDWGIAVKLVHAHNLHRCGTEEAGHIYYF